MARPVDSLQTWDNSPEFGHNNVPVTPVVLNRTPSHDEIIAQMQQPDDAADAVAQPQIGDFVETADGQSLAVVDGNLYAWDRAASQWSQLADGQNEISGVKQLRVGADGQAYYRDAHDVVHAVNRNDQNPGADGAMLSDDTVDFAVSAEGKMAALGADGNVAVLGESGGSPVWTDVGLKVDDGRGGSLAFNDRGQLWAMGADQKVQQGTPSKKTGGLFDWKPLGDRPVAAEGNPALRTDRYGTIVAGDGLDHAWRPVERPDGSTSWLSMKPGANPAERYAAAAARAGTGAPWYVPQFLEPDYPGQSLTQRWGDWIKSHQPFQQTTGSFADAPARLRSQIQDDLRQLNSRGAMAGDVAEAVEANYAAQSAFYDASDQVEANAHDVLDRLEKGLGLSRSPDGRTLNGTIDSRYLARPELVRSDSNTLWAVKKAREQLYPPQNERDSLLYGPQNERIDGRPDGLGGDEINRRIDALLEKNVYLGADTSRQLVRDGEGTLTAHVVKNKLGVLTGKLVNDHATLQSLVRGAAVGRTNFRPLLNHLDGNTISTLYKNNFDNLDRAGHFLENYDRLTAGLSSSDGHKLNRALTAQGSLPRPTSEQFASMVKNLRPGQSMTLSTGSGAGLEFNRLREVFYPARVSTPSTLQNPIGVGAYLEAGPVGDVGGGRSRQLVFQRTDQGVELSFEKAGTVSGSAGGRFAAGVSLGYPNNGVAWMEYDPNVKVGAARRIDNDVRATIPESRMDEAIKGLYEGRLSPNELLSQADSVSNTRGKTSTFKVNLDVLSANYANSLRQPMFNTASGEPARSRFNAVSAIAWGGWEGSYATGSSTQRGPDGQTAVEQTNQWDHHADLNLGHKGELRLTFPDARAGGMPSDIQSRQQWLQAQLTPGQQLASTALVDRGLNVEMDGEGRVLSVTKDMSVKGSAADSVPQLKSLLDGAGETGRSHWEELSGKAKPVNVQLELTPEALARVNDAAACTSVADTVKAVNEAVGDPASLRVRNFGTSSDTGYSTSAEPHAAGLVLKSRAGLNVSDPGGVSVNYAADGQAALEPHGFLEPGARDALKSQFLPEAIGEPKAGSGGLTFNRAMAVAAVPLGALSIAQGAGRIRQIDAALQDPNLKPEERQRLQGERGIAAVGIGTDVTALAGVGLGEAAGMAGARAGALALGSQALGAFAGLTGFSLGVHGAVNDFARARGELNPLDKANDERNGRFASAEAAFGALSAIPGANAVGVVGGLVTGIAQNAANAGSQIDYMNSYGAGIGWLERLGAGATLFFGGQITGDARTRFERNSANVQSTVGTAMAATQYLEHAAPGSTVVMPRALWTTAPGPDGKPVLAPMNDAARNLDLNDIAGSALDANALAAQVRQYRLDAGITDDKIQQYRAAAGENADALQAKLDADGLTDAQRKAVYEDLRQAVFAGVANGSGPVIYTGSNNDETVQGNWNRENVLYAGNGHKEFTGGNRNDTFIYTGANAPGTASVFDGKGGVNSLSVAPAPGPEGFDIDLARGSFFRMGDGSHSIAQLFGIQNVNGSSRSDNIVGNDQANFIDGGGSLWDYQHQSGGDTINGGGGDDTIIFHFTDKIDGGTGRNTVIFSDDNRGDWGYDMRSGEVTRVNGDPAGEAKNFDVVYGSSGAAEYIIGNDRGNFIDGRGSKPKDEAPENQALPAKGDTIKGGTGDDTIVHHAMDRIDGGAGINTLMLNNDGAGGRQYDMGTGEIRNENGQVIGQALSFTRVFGSAGNDTIKAGDAGAWISAGAGVNVVQGGAANDTLIGGSGTDVAQAGDQGDLLVQGSNNWKDVAGLVMSGAQPTGDAAAGQAADGSTPADPASNNGSNTLSGGGGQNVIYTGDGHDTLLGGQGQDTLMSGDVNNVVRDTGATGNNTVMLTGGTHYVGKRTGDALKIVDTDSGSAVDIPDFYKYGANQPLVLMPDGSSVDYAGLADGQTSNGAAGQASGGAVTGSTTLDGQGNADNYVVNTSKSGNGNDGNTTIAYMQMQKARADGDPAEIARWTQEYEKVLQASANKAEVAA